ncbi:MAG: outer membrane lipoprotein-sorting protein [Spirochaetia bacterium]|jgi:hypothetical protein|nr:outer membrane lipoprotein-sorting protein [Spirochaetia bacterium]
MTGKVIRLVLFLAVSAAAQENSADFPPLETAILLKADTIMRVPQGGSAGRIKHIHPGGASFTIDFTATRSDDNSLFIFYNKERAIQLEVLYTLGGENIHVYLMHARKLIRKTGADKYEPVLYTNFSYIDLSGYRLAANYTAALAGKETVNSKSCHKLELKPIFADSQYGRLTLYADEKDFLPLKIEFRGKDEILNKVLSLAKTARKADTIVPIRYEMRDIRSGDVSILVFNSFGGQIPPEKNLFLPENLPTGYRSAERAHDVQKTRGLGK